MTADLREQRAPIRGPDVYSEVFFNNLAQAIAAARRNGSIVAPNGMDRQNGSFHVSWKPSSPLQLISVGGTIPFHSDWMQFTGPKQNYQGPMGCIAYATLASPLQPDPIHYGWKVGFVSAFDSVADWPIKKVEVVPFVSVLEPEQYGLPRLIDFMREYTNPQVFFSLVHEALAKKELLFIPPAAASA